MLIWSVILIFWQWVAYSIIVFIYFTVIFWHKMHTYCFYKIEMCWHKVQLHLNYISATIFDIWTSWRLDVRFRVLFIWVNSSIFNQSHFFKIKIKVRGVLNLSFFTMNHFTYACIRREEGYVPKFSYVLAGTEGQKL